MVEAVAKGWALGLSLGGVGSRGIYRGTRFQIQPRRGSQSGEASDKISTWGIRTLGESFRRNWRRPVGLWQQFTGCDGPLWNGSVGA